MDSAIILLIGLIIGGVLGAIIAWLFARSRAASNLVDLRARAAALESQTQNDAQRIRWLESSEQRQRETFQALAGQSLQQNSEHFLQRAQDQWQAQRAEFDRLVSPLRENLGELDNAVRDLESKREGAYAGLNQQLANLNLTHLQLQQTTSTLAEAMKSSTARGKWGELQLLRVIEMSGMKSHVDFEEQSGVEDGRPDVIIKLPGKGELPVDAKAPMSAYLSASNARDAKERKRYLDEYATGFRHHIQTLCGRGYWGKLARSPEFVIMFIPGETFLSVAFEHEPDLFDYALENKVLIASPITLLALLKAVAYGWQQQDLAENAHKIAYQGKEVYDRLNVFLTHLSGLNKNLNQAIDAYNRAIGSLDTRLIPSVRKLADMGISDGNLELPKSVDVRAKVSNYASGQGQNDSFLE